MSRSSPSRSRPTTGYTPRPLDPFEQYPSGRPDDYYRDTNGYGRSAESPVVASRERLLAASARINAIQDRYNEKINSNNNNNNALHDDVRYGRSNSPPRDRPVSPTRPASGRSEWEERELRERLRQREIEEHAAAHEQMYGNGRPSGGSPRLMSPVEVTTRVHRAHRMSGNVEIDMYMKELETEVELRELQNMKMQGKLEEALRMIESMQNERTVLVDRLERSLCASYLFQSPAQAIPKWSKSFFVLEQDDVCFTEDPQSSHYQGVFNYTQFEVELGQTERTLVLRERRATGKGPEVLVLHAEGEENFHKWVCALAISSFGSGVHQHIENAIASSFNHHPTTPPVAAQAPQKVVQPTGTTFPVTSSSTVAMQQYQQQQQQQQQQVGSVSSAQAWQQQQSVVGGVPPQQVMSSPQSAVVQAPSTTGPATNMPLPSLTPSVPLSPPVHTAAGGAVGGGGDMMSQTGPVQSKAASMPSASRGPKASSSPTTVVSQSVTEQISSPAMGSASPSVSSPAHGNVNVPPAPVHTAEELNTYKELLLHGTVFVKFGRQGKPHPRLVSVNAELSHVSWYDPANRVRALGMIPVSTISHIAAGRTTEVFRKHPDPRKEDMSFAIIARPRSLNLVAISKQERDMWVAAFHALQSGKLKATPVPAHGTTTTFSAQSSPPAYTNSAVPHSVAHGASSSSHMHAR